MTLERTNEGRELRLASRGAGRFLSAGFLAFWLCGWAVGETLVLWILAKGAIALLTGQPPDPGREPLEPGPAILTGVFLLFWVTLWTFGGVMAISELLRLLWGADRIVVTSGRLTVTWSRGLFRSRRAFERGEIRSVHLVGRANRLALETTRGRVELSSLGTPGERIEGAQSLRNELNLPAADTNSSGVLPSAWEEIITPEGERALIADRSTRRKQAWVASGFAVAVATVAFIVGRGIVRRPELSIPVIILLVFAGLATAGAIWLARGRMEWRIGGGRLVLRKRFGSKLRDVFEARALRIETTNDSDGDTWYALYALRDASASSPMVGPPKHGKTITRVMDDSSSVRDLALWLSRAADVPLDDRSTAQAQAVDLAALKAQLEKSGRFGKWAAKVVDRLERPR